MGRWYGPVSMANDLSDYKSYQNQGPNWFGIIVLCIIILICIASC